MKTEAQANYERVHDHSANAMAEWAYQRAEEVAADVAALTEQIADMTAKYKYFCDLWNPMVERQHEFDQRIRHQYERIQALEQRTASQQTVAADDPHGVDECKCRHERHWHSRLDSECRYPGCPCMSFKPYLAVLRGLIGGAGDE